MRYLLIDFINPEGLVGVTKNSGKIKCNIPLIKGLQDQIDVLRKTSKSSFVTMMVAGRWIMVYMGNVENDENDVMIFVDFRSDFELPIIKQVFTTDAFNNIRKMQTEYKRVFTSQLDTVELSYAEPYEKVLTGNLFACHNDNIVLAKARQLGALFMTSPIGKNTAKVSLVDEKLIINDIQTVNVYALIQFGETNGEKSGYTYLKLYDLVRNFRQANEFLTAIEGIDTNFDRAFFMEKYTPEKWN
jgi:hypothetical protein